MNSGDVVDLYSQLESRGIHIWLDGGWGVDALLGEQTRPHADLDIAIEEKDVPAMRAFLESRGYHDVPRDDTVPWNFVLGDNDGRLIDVHVIVLDAAGNGIYGPAERGEMYPAGSLTGTGTVDGLPVRCISPEYLVRFHIGYRLRASDVHDVTALCTRFNIPLPEQYAGSKNELQGRNPLQT